MEVAWVRRAKVDFWLTVPRKEDETLTDDVPADVSFSTGRMVMVRKVSISRDAMAVSSPCWEMSGINTEKELGTGTDTPGLNKIDVLACPLRDDATELVRRRRRGFCGEPYGARDTSDTLAFDSETPAAKILRERGSRDSMSE